MGCLSGPFSMLQHAALQQSGLHSEQSECTWSQATGVYGDGEMLGMLNSMLSTPWGCGPLVAVQESVGHE